MRRASSEIEHILGLIALSRQHNNLVKPLITDNYYCQHVTIAVWYLGQIATTGCVVHDTFILSYSCLASTGDILTIVKIPFDYSKGEIHGMLHAMKLISRYVCNYIN